MISAFGVDHGDEVSKKLSEGAKAGLMATGAVGAGIGAAGGIVAAHNKRQSGDWKGAARSKGFKMKSTKDWADMYSGRTQEQLRAQKGKS